VFLIERLLEANHPFTELTEIYMVGWWIGYPFFNLIFTFKDIRAGNIQPLILAFKTNWWMVPALALPNIQTIDFLLELTHFHVNPDIQFFILAWLVLGCFNYRHMKKQIREKFEAIKQKDADNLADNNYDELWGYKLRDMFGSNLVVEDGVIHILDDDLD